MSGETLGLLIGGIVCMAVLFLVHFIVKKATKKEIDESDLWNEVYRKEEDLEYPELFEEQSLDPKLMTPTDKKMHIMQLSKLASKLRDSTFSTKEEDDE